MRRYQATGFIPINFPPARRNLRAAVVAIVKGDALHDNVAGRLTNATTSFAATLMGIAAADCDNDPEASLEAEYYPIDPNTRYIVPVGNALITETAIGTVINLNTTCNTVTTGTTVAEGYGFLVEDIDVSTEAVAANTYGYAIGRIIQVGVQA